MDRLAGAQFPQAGIRLVEVGKGSLPHFFERHEVLHLGRAEQPF